MKINVTNLNLFKPLYWPVNEESCAFLVGHKLKNRFIVEDVWPTPNITERPKDTAYAIGKDSWRGAKQRAEGLNMVIIGHAHSHVNDVILPSDFDYRYIYPGELGAVLHTGSRKLTFYTKDGCLETVIIPSPNILVRLMDWLF